MYFDLFISCKKQSVTMYTYCASKYFRISSVFSVTILNVETEVNGNNL